MQTTWLMCSQIWPTCCDISIAGWCLIRFQALFAPLFDLVCSNSQIQISARDSSSNKMSSNWKIQELVLSLVISSGHFGAQWLLACWKDVVRNLAIYNYDRLYQYCDRVMILSKYKQTILTPSNNETLKRIASQFSTEFGGQGHNLRRFYKEATVTLNHLKKHPLHK